MTKFLLSLSLIFLLSHEAHAAFNAEEVAMRGKPGDSAEFTSEAVHLADVIAENAGEVAKLLKDGFSLTSVKIEIIASTDKARFSDTKRYRLAAHRFDRDGLSPFTGKTLRRSLVLDGVTGLSKSWDQKIHYTSSGVRTLDATNE